MTLRRLAGVGPRRLRRGGLLFLGMTLLLAMSFSGSANAAGESIYITPPTGAKTGVSYSFTVSGYAPQTEQLYFFDDVESCGPSPYVEHAVHNANGDDDTVTGNFQYVSSGWSSPRATTYYVCAYLVDASESSNPAGGVLAEKFQSFAVQAGLVSCSGTAGNDFFKSLQVTRVGCVTGRQIMRGFASAYFKNPRNRSLEVNGFRCGVRVVYTAQDPDGTGYVTCSRGSARVKFTGHP